MITPLLSDPQPVGRAFALVQPASDRSLNPEPVKSTEEQVEVIKVGVAHWLLFLMKEMAYVCLVVMSVFNIRVCLSLLQVYLEARRQEQQKHQQSLKMLSDEVSQIQEVSLCINTHYSLLRYVTICIM